MPQRPGAFYQISDEKKTAGKSRGPFVLGRDLAYSLYMAFSFSRC